MKLWSILSVFFALGAAFFLGFVSDGERATAQVGLWNTGHRHERRIYGNRRSTFL